MRSGIGCAWIGLLALTASASTAGAQDARTSSPPTVRDVALSADTIGLGDRFELRFTLDLPAEGVAFFPDSLGAPGFESFGPVEWTATEAVDGGVALSVVYPLIAFQVGSVAVPELDVFVGPSDESEAAGLSALGDRVGAWSSFREAPAAVPSTWIDSVPEQRLWVASVLVLDDITTPLAPRPPADVSGGDRDWSSTILMTLFGLLLVGVVTVSARDWMAASRDAGPVSPPDPRTTALDALDELFEEAPHRSGHTRDFYTGWSDIVRRYVEGFTPEWGPSWTSSELMAELQGPRRAIATAHAVSADEIAPEMRLAERVKFGGERPDAEVAERHWRTVRDWVAGTEPGGGAR